jgi:DNA-binding HxlR family transcriptional regulator
MQKKIVHRSDCPLSSALDFFGDRWSLLIIRDLIYFGERTFKNFSDGNEGISSARLSDRLARLEDLNVITKKDHPTNKKVYLYNLTQKGVDLFPIIAEYILWSDKYLESHISVQAKEFANQLKRDKEGTIQYLTSKVKLEQGE